MIGELQRTAETGLVQGEVVVVGGRAEHDPAVPVPLDRGPFGEAEYVAVEPRGPVEVFNEEADRADPDDLDRPGHHDPVDRVRRRVGRGGAMTRGNGGTCAQRVFDLGGLRWLRQTGPL